MSNDVQLGITITVNAGNTSTTTQSVVQGINQIDVAAKRTQRSLKDMGSGWNKAIGQLRTKDVLGIASAYKIAQKAAEAFRMSIRIGDDYANLKARIQLASRNQEEFNTALRETFRIAMANRAPLKETAQLYYRLANSSRSLGLDQKQTLLLTDLISKSLKVSGASATETAAGLQQLSQALQAGVLNGDEFRSTVENNARMVRALTDHFKVNIATLRDWSAAGKLTSEKVVEAIFQQREAIENDFKNIPLTVEGAITQLGNAVEYFIGKTSEVLPVGKKIAEGIHAISEEIVRAADAMKQATAASSEHQIEVLERNIAWTENMLRYAAKFGFTGIAKSLEEDLMGMRDNLTKTKTIIADFQKETSAESGRPPSFFDQEANAALEATLAARKYTEEQKNNIRMIVEEAAKAKVNPAFALALFGQESSYRQGAVSNKGAIGLAQLMPATARRFEVGDINDPRQNVQGGLRYVSYLEKMFKNPALVAAAYNSGENNVLNFGNNIPPFPETQNHVSKVGAGFKEWADALKLSNNELETAEQHTDRMQSSMRLMSSMRADEEAKAQANATNTIERSNTEIAGIQAQIKMVEDRSTAELALARTLDDKYRIASAAEVEIKNLKGTELAESLSQIQTEKDLIRTKIDGLQAELKASQEGEGAYLKQAEIKRQITALQTELTTKEQERIQAVLSGSAGMIESEQTLKDLKQGETITIANLVKSYEDELRIFEKLSKAKADGADPKQLGVMRRILQQTFSQGDDISDAEWERVQKLIIATEGLGAANDALTESTKKQKDNVQKLAQIWDRAANRAKSYAQTIGEVNGDRNDPFAKLADSAADFSKNIKQIEKDYETLSKQEGADEQYLSMQKNLDVAGETFNMLTQTALAMRSMFEEGTTGYQAMAAAAGAFSAVLKARQIIEGVLAVIYHLGHGDVYSAIPRAAAVAGVIASMGVGVSASSAGAGATYKKQDGSEYDRNKMTGTVFGDSSAQSTSILDAINIIKENSSTDLNYSADMLAALQNIEQAMTGVTDALILKAIPALTKPEAFNIPFLFGRMKEMTDWGIQANPQKLKDVLEKGFYGQIYTTVKTTTTFLGQKMGESVKTTTKALDSGVADEFTRVIRSIRTGLIEAGKTFGLAAEDFDNRLKNFIIQFGKTSLMGLKGEELQRQVQAMFSAIADQMAQAFVPRLGAFRQVGEGYFKTFIRVAEGLNRARQELDAIGIQAIQLAEIQKRDRKKDVAAQIVRQSIATAELDSSISRYIQTAVGSAEDLIQAYQDLVKVRNVFLMAGLNTANIGTTMINAAGGVSKFLSSMESFRDNFFTPEERLAGGWQDMAREFQKLNLRMPTTNKEFRKLVQGIDTTTEGGQRLFARVISLAEAFNELQTSVDDFASDVVDAFETLRDLTISLQEYLDGLPASEKSIGSPWDQYNASKALFASTLEKANAGDVNAQGNLQSIADAFLTISQQYFAGTERYVADYNQVTSGISGFIAAAKAQMSVAEQQVAALQNLNGSVKDLTQALDAYNKAVAGSTSAATGGRSVEQANADNASAQAAADAAKAALPGRQMAAKGFQAWLDVYQGMVASATGKKKERALGLLNQTLAQIASSPFGLMAENMRPGGGTTNDRWKVKLRARGGMTVGPTIVGEQGPELIDFPSNVNVLSNGQSRSTLAGLAEAIRVLGDRQEAMLRSGIKVDQAGYLALVEELKLLNERMATLESNSKLERAA